MALLQAGAARMDREQYKSWQTMLMEGDDPVQFTAEPIRKPEIRFDEIASVEEVARYFKVSKPTIRKWIKSGQLRAINFGTKGRKLWRIPWAAVRQLRDSRENL